MWAELALERKAHRRQWGVLYFNEACAAVLGPFDSASRLTSNVLRRLFLDDAWRVGFESWDDLHRR